MEIICLILISLSFAGIVEKSGMVSTVTERALKNAKKDSTVITATLLSTIFTNFATGVQYVALIIPGRMFKDIYKERGTEHCDYLHCYLYRSSLPDYMCCRSGTAAAQ